MKNLIPRKSRSHFVLALGCICAGLLFIFGTHSPLIGSVYVALAFTVAVIGLVLPSNIGDSSAVDCSVIMILFLPLTINVGWPEISVFAVVGVLLVSSIISALVYRSKTQKLLGLMWELADKHGYGAQQVKDLATFKRHRYNYSIDEWKLTQGQKPAFYPNARAVQLVISKLR